MNSTIALSLSGSQLQLQLSTHASRIGMSKLFDRLRLPAKAASGAEEAQPQIKHEFNASDSLREFLPALEQAFGNLAAASGAALKGAELEVQLGLAHSRVGVMDLSLTSQGALTRVACEAYARAWVEQMWLQDPSGQVIRWQASESGRKLVISSVDLGVFEKVKEFAGEHSLRFSRCRPAILVTATRTCTPGTDEVATVVWTEPGANSARANIVQLLQFKNKQLAASWRGWLAPPACAAGSDVALEGALLRFQSRYDQGCAGTVSRIRWPDTSTDSARLAVV